MIIDEENNNIFIVEKLNSLKNELNRDQVNLKSVRRDIKQLEDYDNASQYEYLNNLLDPKRCKGVKVPSKCPIPTCSFQMHNYLTFKTNNVGADVFGINPWFLASNSYQNQQIKIENITWRLRDNAGMYFFNSSARIDGTQYSNYFGFPQGFSQNIPDVYDRYRLVSACIEVRYIGPLDEIKGVIGGGIAYTKSNFLGVRFGETLTSDDSYGTMCPAYAEYGNFELIRDSYYNCENLCLEGLRMLYFPLDNSFNEFKRVFKGGKDILSVEHIVPDTGRGVTITISDDCFKSGFNWFVYTLGAPYVANGRNFRIDYYFNYECIPKAEFMNYMPVSLDCKPVMTEQVKKKIMEEVQGKALQKLNIY